VVRFAGRGALVLRKFLAGVGVWRRQDPIDVGRCVLKKRRGQNLVMELCEIEGNEVVQRLIKRGQSLTAKRQHPRFPVVVRQLCFLAAWRRFWLGFRVDERG
jgi:hypothetical protein